MLSTERQRRLIGTFTILIIVIALGLGCDGFFVDPVLTGIAVGPATTIQTGNTVQMSAVGTYNDGSQKALSSNVHWSSVTPDVANVNASGLVTGVSPGQATISGASETVVGSATVTVTVGNLSSIMVTSQDGLNSITYGSTEQFIATGTAGGTQIDITSSVTWSTDPSRIPSVSIDTNTGLLTTTSGPSSIVQFDVIATDPPTGISDRMTFTVRP
jgi:Bacterial Ig-like domain (group 2)